MNRWTADCFDPSHIGQVDLQAMEDNLESLRTHFQDDDDDEPTDPVPGMFRFRSVNGVLYARNADNDGWYGFLDLATGVLHEDVFPDSFVGTDKIEDLAVTEGKIAAGAVTGTKIADLAVSEGKIAANAVTTTKILDGSITVAKNANATAGDYAFLGCVVARTASLFMGMGTYKMKEMKADRAGTVRAEYSLTTPVVFSYQHAVYKNGSRVGTLRSGPGYAGTSVYTDDIACAVGDLIQIYVIGGGGGGIGETLTVTCNSLRLCCAEFGANRSY